MRQEHDIQSLDVLEVQKAFKSDESVIFPNTLNNDWIPAEWKLERFEDVCSLRKETVQPSENRHTKYVGLEHIDSGTSYLERWGVASEVISSKSKFYKGDVLFGKLRPYLDKAVLAEFDGICSTDILVFKSGNQLTSAFLSYFVHTRQFLGYAVQNMNGVNHPRTSWSSLGKYQLPLPPLPQQQAIANVLRKVQEAIQARRDELEIERESKASLMEFLFTHGTQGEPRKQTEIGEVPESWQVVRLEDKLKVKGGKRLPKGADFADKPTTFPYIRIVDFADGSVKKKNLKYITDDLHKQISQYIISKDDVYISIAGTIGLVGTIPTELDGANLTENAARLLINEPDCLDQNYLAKYLSGEIGQLQIDNLTTKTTQPKLALARIEQIRIPIPNIVEQREIAQVLEACDNKIAGVEQEISLMEELFRALLEELMTGRLSTLPLIEGEESHE